MSDTKTLTVEVSASIRDWVVTEASMRDTTISQAVEHLLAKQIKGINAHRRMRAVLCGQDPDRAVAGHWRKMEGKPDVLGDPLLILDPVAKVE